MSIKVFGPVLRANQPHNNALHWFALDVTDTLTHMASGSIITITSITVGNPTMIAYTVAGGSFPAGPQTLVQFQDHLSKGHMARGSYRGTPASSPQWPISAFEAAGLALGEITTPI